MNQETCPKRGFPRISWLSWQNGSGCHGESILSRTNIYPIQDESLFVEREENYEIYREIYGYPIYDIYEDDVRVVDFVFGEDSFANFVCANIGQDEIRAKFGRDNIRAKPV
ncbi:hypothetical protein F2Q69_00041372 [Brassica cretica]|uniref:Uncharacterized protein n=1 Tax=Brassica cretica TaxID=69181 RepID=A0A8S9NT41_BRACR|nr:hypothetical protein F2Q69_00041372 [Brassica cretica]